MRDEERQIFRNNPQVQKADAEFRKQINKCVDAHLKSDYPEDNSVIDFEVRKQQKILEAKGIDVAHALQSAIDSVDE